MGSNGWSRSGCGALAPLPATALAADGRAAGGDPFLDDRAVPADQRAEFDRRGHQSAVAEAVDVPGRTLERGRQPRDIDHRRPVGRRCGGGELRHFVSSDWGVVTRVAASAAVVPKPACSPLCAPYPPGRELAGGRVSRLPGTHPGFGECDSPAAVACYWQFHAYPDQPRPCARRGVRRCHTMAATVARGEGFCSRAGRRSRTLTLSRLPGPAPALCRPALPAGAA